MLKIKVFPNTNKPDYELNKHWERKRECCLCIGFPICLSDNNNFTSDRSLVATERSVTWIMNNSKTGNWKLYRANFTSQMITINGARSVWHFSHPVYHRAGYDVDVHVTGARGLLTCSSLQWNSAGLKESSWIKPRLRRNTRWQLWTYRE